MGAQQLGACWGWASGAEEAVTAQVSGTVASIQVSEGQQVSKNQALVVLTSDDLDDQVQSAQESLRNAQISYEKQTEQLEDYTVTARSKGLPERRILFRHVLKNAMLPYITSLCIQVGSLLSGSMMLEVIFGWKGMGQLFYNAVSNRDFPTAQACFIISATCVVLGNWLGDALVAAIDPRIKEGAVHA